MNQSTIAPEFELAGQVYMNLQCSARAYKEYLDGGKTFLFAKILRIYNEKIRELLLNNGYLLPGDLQKDACELIAHYDIWMQKWDALKERLNPSPDEEFIFPNEHRFPGEAAKNLEQEYFRLKAIQH